MAGANAAARRAADEGVRHGRFGRDPLRGMRQRQLQPAGRAAATTRRSAATIAAPRRGRSANCGRRCSSRRSIIRRRRCGGTSTGCSRPGYSMAMMRLLSVPALALLLAIPASAQRQPPDVTAADRAAHQRMIVLDTHLDIPERWDDGQWDFGVRHRYDEDGSQVDLPRMDEGGLDGGFLVIYTPQGALTPEGYRQARDAALVRAAAIRRVLGENRGRIGLALDPRRCAAAGPRRQAFRLHQHGEQLAARRGSVAAHHLLPARRPARRAGPLPQQPARRQRHRHAALERPVAARPAMGGRDEPARHPDRRQPQLGRGVRSDAAAVARADHRLPFRPARDLRSCPQPRRCAAAAAGGGGRPADDQQRLSRPRRQFARARRDRGAAQEMGDAYPRRAGAAAAATRRR